MKNVPKRLSESDILRLMREVWELHVKGLSEQVDLTLNVAGPDGPQGVLSPELKVLHKKSGIRYTIDSVSTKDVILRTPEGEKFLVSAEELESAYELS